MQANGWAQAVSRADAAFVRRAMQQPLLLREEERALAEAWRDHGDERALHRLINTHTRLVAAVAARYRAYGLAMSDLVQEGCVGLLQAANRFDPGRGIRFSTYATWWIRSAMQDFILRNWSIVRSGTTSSQKALFFNLRRLRARIERNSGQEIDQAGRETIAKALKVRLSDVETMEQRLSGADQSLNAPISEEGDSERISLLGDERAGPEAITLCVTDSAKRSAWLRAALKELSRRERIIIEQRRLLDEGKTLEDLGKVLGVSKERVRQLESRALGKLKAALSRHVELTEDLLPQA